MGRTAKELATEHTEVEWQHKFVALTELLDLLSDCIIASDYTIPDEINEAIALSTAGKDLADRLIRKEGVPVKEAHLMCALTVGHEELFLDIDRCDVDRMVAAIDKQIRNREIRFPFSFGREVYDAYAAAFDDEKEELSIAESFALLDATPMGVYQYGEYVIGPLGMVKSSESRSVHASRHIPAFHCSRPSCRAIHRVYLRTSQDAAVNHHRDKLRRILSEREKEAAEWGAFAGELGGFLDVMYDDRAGAVLIALLGDCLATEELRSVLAYLLDNTKGVVRSLVPDQPRESAQSIAEGLSRADLLQLILLATEKQIRDALDALVRDGSIRIPAGETRVPVINRNRRFGAFELQAELGPLGVRYRSSDPGIASLRLGRLLKRLYLDNDEDRAELEWQLRGYEAERIEDRLEDFFRGSEPRDSLSNLVLARRSNMIAACHEVRLEKYDGLTDDQLVDAILWRLGFPIDHFEDPHAYFWDLHERISSLIRSSRLSGTDESETFRGVASTYFSELEGLLSDALAFTIWALLEDHTSGSFEYDDEHDRAAAIGKIQEIFDNSEATGETLKFNPDKSELYPLFRGFGVLAEELDRLQSTDSFEARVGHELPDYEGRTSLKLFPFKSRQAFASLLPSSKQQIIQGLREIAQKLVSSEVNVVRNSYSHHSRKPQEVHGMTRALDAVGSAIRLIEDLGLAPITWWPSTVNVDRWGRSQHTFDGPRGRTFLFARPSNYDWLGLPGLGSPQYIMQAAVFAEPNEALRFKKKPKSAYSELWSGYPNRRAGGTEAPSTATHTQPAHRSEDAERV